MTARSWPFKAQPLCWPREAAERRHNELEKGRPVSVSAARSGGAGCINAADVAAHDSESAGDADRISVQAPSARAGSAGPSACSRHAERMSEAQRYDQLGGRTTQCSCKRDSSSGAVPIGTAHGVRTGASESSGDAEADGNASRSLSLG